MYTPGRAVSVNGTVDSLSEAAEFVRVIESREGIQISAPEEIAYRNTSLAWAFSPRWKWMPRSVPFTVEEERLSWTKS